MYKDMCNDIRRLVAVYIISIPIERFLSGRKESAADFTKDLLNDMLSLVFYYELAKRMPQIRDEAQPFRKSLIKSGTLLVVNDYLTHNTIHVKKTLTAMLVSTSLNFISKPLLKYTKEQKGMDLSKFEDSLETVIILSLANNSIYDTTAKAISLLLFNLFFKW
jgi:hypothetical protein